ncbi:MAG: hypothetical protein ACPG4W_04045 [Flavobacteriales bacterium]
MIVRLLMFCSIMLAFCACEDDYQPKPNGYFRIQPLEKQYQSLKPEHCPYTIQIPDYYHVELVQNEDCWLNLHSDYYNSTLHLTYSPIHDNLAELIAYYSKVTFQHHTKVADGIKDMVFENPQKRVYSILYEVEGDVPSSIQFISTDSTNHIIRGALYFNSVPNADSIQPVHSEYLESIKYMIEHLTWN